MTKALDKWTDVAAAGKLDAAAMVAAVVATHGAAYAKGLGDGWLDLATGRRLADDRHTRTGMEPIAYLARGAYYVALAFEAKRLAAEVAS